MIRNANPQSDVCQEDFSDSPIPRPALPIPRTNRAVRRITPSRLRKRPPDTPRRHPITCRRDFKRGAGDTGLLNSQLGMSKRPRTGQTEGVALRHRGRSGQCRPAVFRGLRRMEMRTGRTTRIVAALALAVVLAASAAPAHAAGPAAQASWRWPSLAAVWTWFVDCGIMIDPDGRCAAAAVQVDCGSHIDPDGRCAAAATAQTDCGRGIMIDPNGGCTSSLATVPSSGR